LLEEELVFKTQMETKTRLSVHFQGNPIQKDNTTRFLASQREIRTRSDRKIHLLARMPGILITLEVIIRLSEILQLLEMFLVITIQLLGSKRMLLPEILVMPQHSEMVQS